MGSGSTLKFISLPAREISLPKFAMLAPKIIFLIGVLYCTPISTPIV